MQGIRHVFFLVALVAFQSAMAQQSKKSIQHERIEWTNVWIPEAASTSLPRVLLIGNSITQGYYPFVQKSLEGKAYVARYTSSRGILDPVLRKEIKNLIKQHRYELIQFNNGLHGIQYSEAEFEKGFRKLIRMLKKNGQNAKLIGATCTGVLPGFTEWKSDAYNKKLIESRNKIIRDLCQDHQIPVNDLYPLTAFQADFFSEDKIHHTAAGYKLLAGQTVELFLEIIAAPQKNKP